MVVVLLVVARCSRRAIKVVVDEEKSIFDVHAVWSSLCSGVQILHLRLHRGITQLVLQQFFKHDRVGAVQASQTCLGHVWVQPHVSAHSQHKWTTTTHHIIHKQKLDAESVGSSIITVIGHLVPTT